MRVGVTGAGGFTGRYLVAALAAEGHVAAPIDADLTNPLALDREIGATEFDAVIHLAAQAFVASDDLAQFYAVNQIGSFHLLDALARHHPGCRIVLASSAQVYGEGASGLVSEAYPVVPTNHYGLSKRAMEMGAGLWRDRLDLTIVRPFNYTGRGQQARYLIPKIVDHFVRRAPLIELGNIDVERDFGDVRAVVAAYVGLLAVTGDAAPINLATGEGHSVRDVLAIAHALTGHEPEIVINPAFVRANDVQRLVGDSKRLRALLPNWTPGSLRETLAWMLAA